jgi:hypothetical protein
LFGPNEVHKDISYPNYYSRGDFPALRHLTY